jgi:hypothetical protein
MVPGTTEQDYYANRITGAVPEQFTVEKSGSEGEPS